MLPESKLDPLVLVQRARDAQMALRTETAGGGRGGVLITGKGHARTDRGVPALSRRTSPGRRSSPWPSPRCRRGRPTPPPTATTKEGTGPLPYDFVVFTPGTQRESLRGDAPAHGEEEGGGGEGGKDAGGGMGGMGAPKEGPEPAAPAQPPPQPPEDSAPAPR